MASPGDWGVFLIVHLFFFSFLWFFLVKPLTNLTKWQPPPYVEDSRFGEDDYWDGEVNYATGEINTDTGPSVRYPKNRDRAYSGSAERFDDGGW